MAYWTIDFKTIANRHIRIMIDGKTGATNTALTPSDTPCVLEEEGKENLFVPIKTQSGYVEVITDDMTLAEQIIPSTGGTRVVLIYETDSPSLYTIPLWSGFVQPKLLTYKMWRGKQKLQIPIECKISRMKYRRFTPPSQIKTSIRNILYKLLGSFGYAYFQGMTTLPFDQSSTSLQRAWLWKKVYSSIFSSDATEYEVLEKICVFFGWTARQFHRDIYFLANRNVDAPNAELRSVLTNTLSSTPSHTDVFWNEVLLDSNMLANTSNTAKFTAGCRVAKATSNLITFDEELNVDFEPIGEAIDNGTISSVNNADEDEWTEHNHEYTRVVNNFWTGFGQGTPVTIGDFAVSGMNVQPMLNKNDSTDTNDWTTKLSVRYSYDYLKDRYWVPATYDSPGYYAEDVQVDHRYYGELIFRTVNAVTFSTKGTMVINAQTDNIGGSYNPPCFYVMIGSQWYNPLTGGWQSSKPTQWIVQEVTNKDGYFIPIPQTMSGTLYIEFVFNPEYRGLAEQSYELASISVEYTAEQSETYNSQISTVEYSTENGNGLEKEVSFDSLICTKGSLAANSKNFLLNDDESICEGLYDTIYDDAQMFTPLQRLCDQAAEEMAGRGKMYEIVARWRGGLVYDITPLTMIYVAPLNEWCYPVSAKYDLRYDEVKLRLVKRIYEEGNQ
jgi:hypothetical protein